MRRHMEAGSRCRCTDSNRQSSPEKTKETAWLMRWADRNEWPLSHSVTHTRQTRTVFHVLRDTIFLPGHVGATCLRDAQQRRGIFFFFFFFACAWAHGSRPSPRPITAAELDARDAASPPPWKCREGWGRPAEEA